MDTITYEYNGSLYINMTNKCPNRCEFCLRNNSSGSIYADNLWYEGPEPTKEVMLENINTRNLDDYEQVVSVATENRHAVLTICFGLPLKSRKREITA